MHNMKPLKRLLTMVSHFINPAINRVVNKTYQGIKPFQRFLLMQFLMHPASGESGFAVKEEL